MEAGEFDGTIAEYVERNHEAQKNTLDAYGISLSIYEGSGMGHSGDVHPVSYTHLLRRGRCVS